MKRLRWYWAQAHGHLRWAGTVGLVLLLGTSAAHVQMQVFTAHNAPEGAPAAFATSIKPAAAEHRELRRELDGLEAKLNSASLEEWLQAIQDAGAASGVELKRLEYRMLTEKRWRMRQYQIVAPVTSSYPRIRRFIALALSRVTPLSLDSVGFQKKKLGDSNVEAELRFTLFIPDAT